MGRRSVKKNKSVYQISRENAALTRSEAAEQMVFLSDDQIEKIENGKQQAYPEDVLAMADCYRDAYLINHYCTKECAIGKIYVPDVEETDLPRIALSIVHELNALEEKKARLVEIAMDGKISPDELPDFEQIQNELNVISQNVHALRLWLKNTGAEQGKEHPDGF